MERFFRLAPGPDQPADADAGRKNMLLLVQLRWIAVVGQVVTIAAVGWGFGIDLPLGPMALVLGGLVALNAVSLLSLARKPAIGSTGLFLVLLLDVAALTAQLALSGGATNPFISLYLLQVTLGAVLLGARACWALVGVTGTAYALLGAVHRPLVPPPGSPYDLFSLHVAGAFLCFLLVAGLLAIFVVRIARNLRERDDRLAALRQRAAEEDHIVRMGLLASGAAHELGTPLSSLAVILGDWRRMPALANDPELVDEIAHMQAEVGRCKTIVTSILMAAGEPRGEAPRVTTLAAFLHELVGEWRIARGSVALHYDDALGPGAAPDLAIVSDQALKQVIGNVLDNALEVSPDWLSLRAERRGDTLVLCVADDGPGFAPDMLADLGQPYRSTKGAGHGLGLFLVSNALRKLGGTVVAENRPEGGARVTLSLPLASLAVRGG